jgi:hypothetical protein
MPAKFAASVTQEALMRPRDGRTKETWRPKCA